MATAIPYQNGLYEGPYVGDYAGNPTTVPYAEGMRVTGTSDLSGGGGGGGVSSNAALLSGYDSQKNTTIQSALDAARQGGTGLRNSILDFVDSQRSSQSKIDNQAINNELAKSQGVSGVQGMVGRGIRSAGVMLGNRNAGSSSAAGAIGNAYGDLGRREMSKVGNQYEMGNREVGLLQDDLNTQVNTFRDRKYGESKEGIVNGIVESTRSQLAALESAMLGASLPDRIDIQAEIERVKSGALGELAQYDQLMRDQTGSIQAKSADQRRTEAASLAAAGTDLGEGAFDYQSEAPGGFNGGPYASNLPLFTFPRQRRLA